MNQAQTRLALILVMLMMATIYTYWNRTPLRIGSPYSLHELKDFDMSRRRKQGNTAENRQRQAERQHQKKRAVEASVNKHKEEVSRETEAVALWIVKETESGLDIITKTVSDGVFDLPIKSYQPSAWDASATPSATAFQLLESEFKIGKLDLEFSLQLQKGALQGYPKLTSFLVIVAPFANGRVRFNHAKYQVHHAKKLNEMFRADSSAFSAVINDDIAIVYDYLYPWVITAGKDPVQCLGAPLSQSDGGPPIPQTQQKWPRLRGHAAERRPMKAT